VLRALVLFTLAITVVGVAMASAREATTQPPARSTEAASSNAVRNTGVARAGNVGGSDPMRSPACQEAMQRLDAVPEPRTPSEAAILRSRMQEAFASYRAACRS
jgi:hypothetical protein